MTISSADIQRINAEADKLFPLPKRSPGERFFLTGFGVWMSIVAYQMVTDDFVTNFEALAAIGIGVLCGALHASDTRREWRNHSEYVSEALERVRRNDRSNI